MDDLIAFIRERLDEDARIAQEATAGPWHTEESNYGGRIEPEIFDDEGGAIPPGPSDREHIARHDPARVLRDVAAKRAIVERYEKVREYADPKHDPSQPYVLAEGAMRGVIQSLGSVWSDHPAYDERWAP